MIARQAAADAATLRSLLDACTEGWAWDARTLVRGLAQVQASLPWCTEGRAFSQTRDIRWQRRSERFDVLLLTLTEPLPAGFVPLLPAPDQVWQTQPTALCWQVAPVPMPGVPDATYPATAFLAPDGSIQFVALIDSTAGGRDDAG
jgi:hypothetical protein